MKKLFRSPIVLVLLAFALIVGVQVPFVESDDYNLTDDLNWGPPGETRKSAIQKLEGRDETLLGWINEIKDGYASSTAPTAPSEGQLWYDNLSEEMKQYHSSTWVSIYAYSSTTEAGWAGSFSAPYASVTDIDVGTADIGTLTTTNWTQDTATFNTLTVNMSATIDTLTVTNSLTHPSLFSGVHVAVNATHWSTADGAGWEYIIWNYEVLDAGSWWSTGTTVTVPASGHDYIQAGFTLALDVDTTTTDNLLQVFMTGARGCNLDLFDIAIDAGRTREISCTSAPTSVSGSETIRIGVNWQDATGNATLTISGINVTGDMSYLWTNRLN
jgi:hypothetical protein